jgi:two-component system, chemotaxis family, chemotaxis protein CheY
MSAAALGPVLVVDDDPDIREIIELALSSNGYRVVTAVDGRGCLRRLREPERPCIVLLDMMMPDLNGWDVCDAMAKDAALSSIPVLILTGNSQIRDKELGDVPVLRKPIELRALLDAIERHAQRRPTTG